MCMRAPRLSRRVWRIPARLPVGRAWRYDGGVGAELAVVVTVAAIFLVPAALGREGEDGGGSSFWPRGEMGSALDGALMLALVVMAAWVAVLLLRAL